MMILENEMLWQISFSCSMFINRYKRGLLSLDLDSPSISEYDHRYLLLLAGEAGLPWNICIQSIFYAAPHIISIRGMKTGLYPFMLASILNNLYLRCREM